MLQKILVEISGAQSDLRMINAGVPQGRVLGSSLFLSHVADYTTL